MATPAQNLGSALIQAVREIGAERGVDLALNVLFVRWMTLKPGAAKMWSDFANADTDQELLAQFTHLAIFRDGQQLNLQDSDPFAKALRTVAELVDQSVYPALPVAAQHALLSAAFDETLDHLSRLGRESGESETPRSLADLMVALTVRPGDSVLDPACGNGNDLLAAAKSQPNVSVSGFDINQRVSRRAAMRLMVHGVESGTGFGVWCGDAFDETAPGEYDVVLAQPPWGVTLTESQRTRIAGREQRNKMWAISQKTLRGDLHWLLLGLDALRVDGRAAVILPAPSLTPRNRELHEHLLNVGAIEAIISLPAGVFNHTAITTALWLLRAPGRPNPQQSILMIDAATLVESTARGRSALTPVGRDLILDSFAAHRNARDVNTPNHLARVVALKELDLERGMNPLTYLAAPPAEAVTHPVPERTLLTQVDLSNFKAFGQRTSVPLAPLTLVFGANSAGKSSVIQSLLLLQQSRESDALITQGSALNVGGFGAIVHGHGDGEVEIGLSYGVTPDWIPAAGTPDPTLARTARWTFAANNAGQGTLTQALLGFGDYTLTLSRDPEGSNGLTVELEGLSDVFRGIATGTLLYPFDARHNSEGDEAEQARRLRARESNARRALRVLQQDGVTALPVETPTLLRTGAIRLQRDRGADDRDHNIAASYVNRTSQLAAGVTEEINTLLEHLVWLGPLRSAPRRVYDRADTTSTPGDGRHIAIYLFDHTRVVEQVNDWLKQLEIPYTLDVIPVTTGKTAHLIGDLVAISLTDTRSGVNITPADVGFGISQILPIVVELLARRGSIIAIEQPETHLHPRLQARLADLFIDTAQEGGRGNQLIIETHSEHLMIRVQRRIREGTLDPSKVSVVYVDQDPSGQATVQSLRINEHGDFLDEWPHGFFDERLEEMFGTF